MLSPPTKEAAERAYDRAGSTVSDWRIKPSAEAKLIYSGRDEEQKRCSFLLHQLLPPSSFLLVPDDLHVRVNGAKSEPRVEGAWVISSRSFQRGHADRNLSIREALSPSFVRATIQILVYVSSRFPPGCANTQLFPFPIEFPRTYHRERSRSFVALFFHF